MIFVILPQVLTFNANAENFENVWNLGMVPIHHANLSPLLLLEESSALVVI